MPHMPRMPHAGWGSDAAGWGCNPADTRGPSDACHAHVDPSGATKGCYPADMYRSGAADGLGVPPHGLGCHPADIYADAARLGSGCYPADMSAYMYAARLDSPLRTPPGGAPPSPSRLPPPSAAFTKGCHPADMGMHVCMSPSFTKTLPPSAYRAAVAASIERTPPSPHRRHPRTSAAIRAAAVELRHDERPQEASPWVAPGGVPERVPGGLPGGVPAGARAGSPPRAAREAAGREAAGRKASGASADSFLQEAMLEWERMQAAHVSA